MDASIVIPTKNGGELLDKVLSKIENQKTKYIYETICVDSGSKDNTIEIIKKHNCKLYLRNLVMEKHEIMEHHKVQVNILFL